MEGNATAKCPRCENGPQDTYDQDYSEFLRDPIVNALLPGRTFEEVHSSFKHERLPSEEHTRLIDVHPGVGEEKLQCSLRSAVIAQPPPYAALSYTWSVGNPTGRILIGAFTVPVGANLELALLHLRDAKAVRTFWIDAICIDQKNSAERNNQVRRMKIIYENAEEVIVWLGPQADGSDLAMQLLKEIEEICSGNQHDPQFTMQRLLMLNQGASNSDKGSVTFGEDSWSLLNSLLNRTWWWRTWTLQEATVPSSRITIQCCQKSISEILYTLAKAIAFVKLSQPGQLPDAIMELREGRVLKPAELTDARRKHSQGDKTLDSSLHLLALLDTFRPQKTSDMHDRIFAPLGLAIDVPAGQLQMDHSRPFHQIMLDIALFYIANNDYKLTVLGHRGLDDIWGFFHPGETEEDKKKNAMPSWMPDWRPEDASNPYTAIQPFPKAMACETDGKATRVYSPCTRMNPKVSGHPKFSNGPALNAYFDLGWNGFFVDKVGKLSEPCLYGNFHTIEHDWAPDNLLDTYAPTGESMSDAFLHTLVADVKLQGGQAVSRGGSMYWRDTNYIKEDQKQWERLETLRRTVLLRHFVWSERHQYMGLVPMGTKVDDEIWLLSSAETFSILRPVKEDRYHFVGECYLHGMMDGKAMEPFLEGTVKAQRVWLNGFYRPPSEASNPPTAPPTNKNRALTLADIKQVKVETPDKPSNRGIDAVVKTFYEGEYGDWMETPPKLLSDKVSQIYDRVAIKVYKDQDPEEVVIAGHQTLRIRSIEIQSPILVAALKDILEPLGTFLEIHEKALFSQPFKPLFFAQATIAALYEAQVEPTVLRKHLRLLTQVMAESFGNTMARVRNMRESQLVRYDLVWTLFPKDCILYCGDRDCERLFRVVDTKYGSSGMRISCQDIAFDGSAFAWRKRDLIIPEFEENIPIVRLPYYPLSFRDDQDSLKDKLTSRGS